MPFLLIAAAASFACASPSHHDGDNIRCGSGPSMRLHGIDAPEMPGSCRPGRECTPGDPFAARDTLRGLTAGRTPVCAQVDTDNYGRPVVDCTVDGRNLGCEMIAAGQAVPRYGRLQCARPELSREVASGVVVAEAPIEADAPQLSIEGWTGRTDPPATKAPAPRTRLAQTPQETLESRAARFPLWVAGLWLLLVNLIAYAAMAIDKRRAIRGGQRIPEATLLGLAIIGGTPATILAQRRLRHKTVKQPFASLLLIIAGIQIGALAGLGLWSVMPG